MEQTITFEVAASEAQVLQALVAKARSAGQTINEMFAGLSRNEQPLTLATDSGTVVFHDLASYEKLLDEIETAEALAGIQRGLESMRAGRGKPMKEAFEEIRRDLNLPERPLKCSTKSHSKIALARTSKKQRVG